MKLQEALEQIHTLLRMMTPSDRYDWFYNQEEHWIEEKLEDWLKSIMPEYKVFVYKTSNSRHVDIDSIAPLDAVAKDIIRVANGKFLTSIEQETFCEDELKDYELLVVAIQAF